MLGLGRRKANLPALPPGRRVYVVGDIHGRLDLFERLLGMIRADHHARPDPAPKAEIVLLGDLIDRGPESAGVVARAMNPPDWARFIVLKGNHESAMLDALGGDREMMQIWMRNGGEAALRSWGVPDAVLRNGTIAELIEVAQARVPHDVRLWLARAHQSMQLGDYFFVHAGVRPRVALDRQELRDALWIRDEFLDSKLMHGAMIVHGHSVSTDVEERPNRIGIDTGAYASGRLTALGLEGTDRWLIQTAASDGEAATGAVRERERERSRA